MVAGYSYGGTVCSQCGETWYTDHTCKAAPLRGTVGESEAEVDAKFDLEKIARESGVDFDSNIGG